jgi:bifunctional non-homologous end joining protein LigD
MSLILYNKKRKFNETREPKGKKEKPTNAHKLRFVVQKHDASHLHYDLRLEMDGVMKSWAVPKGPSMDPSVKRLAMQVEDHPISYNTFEGEIPEGNYGAGQVIVWDSGFYKPEEVKKDEFKLTLNGKKLKGSFALFRFKKDDSKEWMLVKHKDKYATEEDVTTDPRSVLSKRMLIGRREDTTKYVDFIKQKGKAR